MMFGRSPTPRRALCRTAGILLVLWQVTGCVPLGGTQSTALHPAVLETAGPRISTADREYEDRAEGLSYAEAITLGSLEMVDGYPLYVMHYAGAYDFGVSQETSAPTFAAVGHSTPANGWACSLFVALGDEDNVLYGRNFDWEYSPALLLYTDPPDGYASVSMVDIAYLGFGGEKAKGITDLPLASRRSLLRAPFIPFDGMNEKGVAVGMAAVPPGDMQPDPEKETISSLMVIREILDHAANVEDAVSILRGYNVDMGGGPPIHYLIADRAGRSAVVEFYQGRIVVIPTEGLWQHATNFLLASVDDPAQGGCWRYDLIGQQLQDVSGWIDQGEAILILESVSQPGTQWSIVYLMTSGDVVVAMGRQYDVLHSFPLEAPED